MMRPESAIPFCAYSAFSASTWAFTSARERETSGLEAERELGDFAKESMKGEIRDEDGWKRGYIVC